MRAANIVRAFAEALSAAAGPLGAPIKFAASLYDDVRAEERDAVLKAAIDEGRTLSKDVLGDLFELKQGMSTLRAEFVAGLVALCEVLARDPDLRSRQSEWGSLLPTSIVARKDIIEASGFITEDVLIEELAGCYEYAPDLFKATIGRAKFPLRNIHQEAPLNVQVFDFVRSMNNLPASDCARIYGILARENDGSTILQRVAEVYREMARRTSSGVVDVCKPFEHYLGSYSEDIQKEICQCFQNRAPRLQYLAQLAGLRAQGNLGDSDIYISDLLGELRTRNKDVLVKFFSNISQECDGSDLFKKVVAALSSDEPSVEEEENGDDPRCLGGEQLTADGDVRGQSVVVASASLPSDKTAPKGSPVKAGGEFRSSLYQPGMNMLRVVLRPLVVNTQTGDAVEEQIYNLRDEMEVLFGVTGPYNTSSEITFEVCDPLEVTRELASGVLAFNEDYDVIGLWNAEHSDQPGEIGAIFQFVLTELPIHYWENNHGALPQISYSASEGKVTLMPGRHAVFSLHESVNDPWHGKASSDVSWEYTRLRTGVFLLRNLIRSCGGENFLCLHERRWLGKPQCLMFNPGSDAERTHQWIMKQLNFKLCGQCEKVWKAASESGGSRQDVVRLLSGHIGSACTALSTLRLTMSRA